jgi:hypothetical protein
MGGLAFVRAAERLRAARAYWIVLAGVPAAREGSGPAWGRTLDAGRVRFLCRSAATRTRSCPIPMTPVGPLGIRNWKPPSKILLEQLVFAMLKAVVLCPILIIHGTHLTLLTFLPSGWLRCLTFSS